MKINSNSLIHETFKKEIGHHGTQFLKNKPTYSFHIAWQDLPKGTQSLALLFIDYDAIPVCGFPWIHWTVANIDPQLTELPENASKTMRLLEGVTSWHSKLLPEEHRLTKEEDAGFGGCAPPDKAHLYTIKVYALDTKLNLTRGFYLNELLKAMAGHVLDKAVLEGLYPAK